MLGDAAQESTRSDENEDPDFFWMSDSLPLPSGSPTLPKTIGPYDVLGHLGGGGMGEVFLAVDRVLKRRIAIKRIRADRAEAEDMKRRFRVEACVTARLQHPSVIPVYHFDDESPQGFYTMRPVEGKTLHSLVRQLRDNPSSAREEWSIARTLRLFLQAANAVAYAHSRGVIHRDLKPANIIVGPFEEVLVLDWGLAKLDGEESGKQEAVHLFPDVSDLTVETGTADWVGTPAYMAPEQFDGEPANEKTDIFSLGVILYELLALRHPWKGVGAYGKDAMKDPPAYPSSLQPGRRIPGSLDEVTLRALSYDPSRRPSSVGAFALDVARTLEGRAAWVPQAAPAGGGGWRLADGRMREEEGGVIVLRSRGERGPFRYVFPRSLTTNVRVTFDLLMRKGPHELAVWLNATLGDRGEALDGYTMPVVAGRKGTLSLLRSGRDVAGAKSPGFSLRQWHRIMVSRADDRLTLHVDGEEVYAYSDVVPLRGGFVGLTGRTNGISIRNLRVESRGTDARVSCLAIPDAFFRRGLFEEARTEYDVVARAHPRRLEGQVARFRSGLCLLELHDAEANQEVAELLLGDALAAFTDGDRIQGSCLADLGRAMVAGMRNRPAEKHEALSRALGGHPDDPHMGVVVEWILARLHGVDDSRRRTIGELLPLAIDYCMEHWGRRVVSDLLRTIRHNWETPPFMATRGRFREGDPASRAEAKLFCAFWVGRLEILARVPHDLSALGELRPRHVADVVFAFLALGRPAEARACLEFGEGRLAEMAALNPRARRTLTMAGVAVRANEGDADGAAADWMASEPDPGDRACNTARLWLARVAWAAGDPRRTRRVLRSLGSRDTFAREHLAWYLLLDGDPRGARRVMAPLIERKDHLIGRNLTNVLLGAATCAEGRPDEARAIWASLPPATWPRTWTLGAYLGSGRLGGGSTERYLEEAFPWEARTLEEHKELLDRAGWR